VYIGHLGRPQHTCTCLRHLNAYTGCLAIDVHTDASGTFDMHTAAYRVPCPQRADAMGASGNLDAYTGHLTLNVHADTSGTLD
jgi:hypothetical protein